MSALSSFAIRAVAAAAASSSTSRAKSARAAVRTTTALRASGDGRRRCLVAAAAGWGDGLRSAARGGGDGDERARAPARDDEDVYEDDGRGAVARERDRATRKVTRNQNYERRFADEGERGERRPSRRGGDRDGGRDDRFGSRNYNYGASARGGDRRDDRQRRGRGSSGYGDGDERRRGRDVDRRGAAYEDDVAAPPPLRKGMRRFYATCHPGLEHVVAAELASSEINASDIAVGKSGVGFTGTQRVGYDANIWLRSAVRVLVELSRGYLDPQVSGTESIYEFVKHAVPWEEVIPERDGLKFGVETRVWDCSQISSSHAAKIRVKDAICDALVDATGTRPMPPDNYAAADVPLYVTLYRDEAILYRDMSGESLHRRGYRAAMHRASLSESAAAGMLSLAGWPQMLSEWRRDPERLPPPVLIDPMCGSGTFLIEGALMAANVAPGLIRSETIGYAFERWPDHNQRTFEESLENARRIGAEARAASSVAPIILGNDIHPGAVTLAGQGADTARVGGMINVYRNNCEMFSLKSMNIHSASPRIVVTNPPWGKRIGGDAPIRGKDRRDDDDEYDDGNEFGDDVYDRDTTPVDNGMSPEEALEQVWNSLGVFLKRECPDSSAFVLSGNPAVSRAIRMRASRKMPLGIGGVDCRFLRYDILPPKPDGYVPNANASRQRSNYE